MSAAASVAERLAELLDEIALAGGPTERLQEIMERPSSVPQVPAAERTDALRIPGCVTRVWITGGVVAGRLALAASAEAPVVDGLVRLTCEACLGADPADVLRADLDVLAPLGLDRRVTTTRQRGLAAARERIRALAAGAP